MSIVHIFNQPDFLLGRELMVHSWNARSIISQSKSKISLLLAFALIIGRHCKRVGEQFFVSLCVHDFPVFASNGSPLRLNLTVFGFFVTDGRCYFRLCMHIQVPCNARVFPMISNVSEAIKEKWRKRKWILDPLRMNYKPVWAIWSVIINFSIGIER